MRFQVGRGDWRPSVRIEGLRRYAFIGDSHAYGVGVAPDQTLSANTERQLNGLLPAWPVECVNHGVSGYNLWNSWLAFKYGAQVYDGVVLVLCNNDADLFSRTLPLNYPPSDETRWESTHPYGELVARCFDDITSFSQERSLPVAVVYFNARSTQSQFRIGEIIGNLCASRGICYIDTFAHYRDRNFAPDDLVVSAADFHPSAMAHEAVGRHLAATLKREGWFREYEAREISAAPERILAVARAMVEADHYPPDAALNWAARALNVKSRLTQRMQASGQNVDFSSASTRAAEVLTANSRRWHEIHRIRAFMGEVGTGAHGIPWGLVCAQEMKLRLEELGFALGIGEWNRLAEHLPEAELPQGAPEALASDATALFDSCNLELLRVRDRLVELRSLAAPAEIGSPHDEASMLADLDALSRLVDQIQTEYAALKVAFLNIEGIFEEVRPALSEGQIRHVSRLIGATFTQVKKAFWFMPRLSTIIKRIHDGGRASFTTIEVTVRGGAVQGKQLCQVSGEAEYNVPDRLPFRCTGWFRLDGCTTLVKIWFPLFYAGRLALWTSLPKTSEGVEATLVKVELYNGMKHRITLEPASFYRDRNGRYVSPVIYLP
jgi:hypothetical protein